MTASITHRGPDEDGFLFDGAMGMGIRRLIILDLTSGQQPKSDEAGAIWVGYNGEIYNYLALKERLVERGHRFTTTGDTEIVAHLYEDMDEYCVRELRGMYAFAVWDARKRKLFLVRDRLGIKPLYYSNVNGRLIFASEIKAILQDPEVDVRPNLEALSHFLSLKYVPAPQTLFEGIYALPPGYCLSCTAQGVTARPYWDLSFAEAHQDQRTEASYAEQLEDLLKEVVRMHLMSDVPFGAFLSGGVDSSTIVALMSQYLDEPVKTFSVGFEGDGEALSELPYARIVSRQYQTDHHEVIVRPQDLIDLAETVVWHLDQPIADDACLANYMVARLASQHVKMVLTGEGGDELFAGYARYSGERFSPLFSGLPGSVKTMALKSLGSIPRLRRPKLALYALCQPDEVTRLTNWFALFNADCKNDLLSSGFKERVPETSANPVFARFLAATDAVDPINRMLYVDTKLWLPDDLLARGDKMSMAVSLEARVPLLDHKLVEFAASLPPQLKVRRLTSKYLLKKVGQAWLPPEILYRKKKGFPIPISEWFRGEARGFVRDILSPRAIRQRGLFEPAEVERIFAEHETRFEDHGSPIWALLSLELWYRLFVDRQPLAIRAPVLARTGRSLEIELGGRGG